MKPIKFKIHDLNFILTFAGFAIFTSMTDSISSVAYRGFALVIAFLSLVGSRFRFSGLPKPLIFLLVLMLVLDVKTGIHLMAETGANVASRNQALLFVFFITLLPVLAFASSYRKIHWMPTLVVLEILLFFAVLQGYLSTRGMDVTRFELNARQSTLAFGDNSGYLLLLSLCLFRFVRNTSNRLTRRIFQLLLIAAMIVSVFGIARAGSRGPFLAAIMGALFIFFALQMRKQIGTVLLALAFIFMFGISSAKLEEFAPVLFSRMTDTIEEGDTSGRDVLFANAIEKMKENPITGDNPIILLNDGFTTYHNGYLDVGVGLGWLGFAFYVLLSVWIAIRLITRRHNISNTPQLFCAAMFFLSATRAMTGATLLSNPNYALSIACACILAAKLSSNRLVTPQNQFE